MDLLEARAARAAAIPPPVVNGDRISVVCEPCGLSVDATNNAFGRAMVAAWPAIHSKDCQAHVVPVVVPATPATHETENHSQQRVCRECGCTDDHACPGGCWWVDANLCSRCAGGRGPT